MKRKNMDHTFELRPSTEAFFQLVQHNTYVAYTRLHNKNVAYITFCHYEVLKIHKTDDDESKSRLQQ